MKNRSILLIAALALLIYSCQQKATDTSSDITISPEAGVSYKAGTDVKVNVHYPATVKPDSIVYLIDSVRVSAKKDSSAFSFKTDTMPMGVKVITAKVYEGGKAQDISTNIVLLAAKAPEEMTYKIEKIYPHDTSAYTEGLLYQDGYLYESTGTQGVSDLRKVDLATGKVVQRVKINPKHFGEGSAIVGNKIIMLTWKDRVGYVFDKNTFKLLDTFTNNVGAEGWGMANDGKKLFMDDKTNRIWFLNKDNYRQAGFIDVYDDKKAIDAVNELEYINDKLYANVYTTDTILVINPKTGAVLQRVDMKNLYPNAQRPADFDYNNNVLNGIAWDEKGKRLFVTGKKWPHLYQVSIVKK